MKHIAAVALFTAAVTAAVTSFAADPSPVVIKDAQVQFTPPAGWSVTSKSDQAATGDKNGEVNAVFLAVADGVLAKTVDQLDDAMEKEVQNLKWEKPKPIELNGMKGQSTEGTGTEKGKKIVVKLIALQTPAPKTDLVIVWGCDVTKYEAHKGELEGLFKTLVSVK